MRIASAAWFALFVVGCNPVAIQHGNGGSGGGGGGAAGGGGGGGPPTLNNGPTFRSMCNGATTTITGTVMAPNGADPIPNALVYIPSSTGALTPGVSCDLCTSPADGLAAHTLSGADGKFTLDISDVPGAAQLPFTVDMGRFRRATTIPITACQGNAVGAPNTVLPGKAAPGDDIPKIAVSTGSKDALDLVLSAMGLDANAGYDCFSNQASTPTSPMSNCEKRLAAQGATAPQLADLLKNESMLDQYNMLFISCAVGRFAALSAADQATATTNLQHWVAKGGRLFATDRAYDYVGQPFPSNVSFFGGSTVDAANVGVGNVSMPASYTGRINDMTMSAWLTAIGVLTNGQNTITLGGYLTQWSAVQSVPMATVDEVDATDAQVSVNNMTTTGTYPQTVKFDYPAGSDKACGRVIFSSYHTYGSTTGAMLTPQERILEFLMFEAGACLGTPIG